MSTPVWLRRFGQTLKDNSPSILSAVAAAGVVGTAILAIKATPLALEALREARNDKVVEPVTINNHEDTQELTVKEVVAATWRIYIPTVIVGAATCACIFGSSSISNRKNAAMLGAYTLVDTAFREYKDKVIEQIGAPKEDKVRDAVAAERIENNPVSAATVIVTGSGDQLCHDAVSGRYFRSDIEKIRKAENEFNSQVLGGDMWGSLNDFYTLLGLEHLAIGEVLGWNTLKLLDIKYSSHLTDNGVPCLAIDYRTLPFTDYSKF